MELKKGYKQTEIGAIPEDWDVKQLGEIGECVIGLTYKPSDVKSDGLLVLRSSNVDDGKLKFDDNVFVDVAIPEKLIARKDDLLVCVRNGSRALIGKCALIDETVEGMTFGAFMSVFRTEYSRFVFHQFQSSLVKRQIHENIGATINQITNKNLNSFKIPFPKSKKEQRVIAAALSDVDALLTALDALIAKKRNIKQGAMQDLLAGKRRLPGFSEEWKTRTIGEMFQFLSTANNSRSELSDNGNVNYIHYGDIHVRWKSFLDCDREVLPFIDDDKVKNNPLLEDSDLVMADASEDYGGIGVSVEIKNIGNRKIIAGLHTLLLRGNKDLLADGFKGYLQYIPSFKNALIKVTVGISVYGISKNNIKGISIALPDVPEQHAIVEILSDMDAEIAALEQRREKTRLLKQGMMQELLTGRIRLV